MDVFEAENYRQLVRERIAGLPREGHGQLGRLARYLAVNPTWISQVLSGAKNFTDDQAYGVAKFFEFTDRETLFFLLLLQRERAGNHRLKAFYGGQLESLRIQARQVKSRITTSTELSFEQQAVFYSSWLYTAIHALSSIPDFQNVDAIAAHLRLSRIKVQDVVDWLLRQGLCDEKEGRLKIGPAVTYVDRASPLAARHHGNWRERALNAMTDPAPTNFFFTAPFSISTTDFAAFRKELVGIVDRLSKRVSQTKPEILANLNIDCFQV